MRYLVVVVAAVLVVLLAISGPTLAQQKTAPPATNAASAAEARALLDKYCVTCHNARLKTANLTFDKMDLSQVASDGAVWEKAVRKLRGGMMPPPGMPRPPLAAVDSFVTWLESSLDQAAGANPNPGTVALHRLNRAEYANAMRDLFGIEVDSTALLAADDISDGFDNMANVLKVSPTFLDQYITAAREVAHQAVGQPPPSGPVRVNLRGTPADPADLPLGTRTGTVAEYLFPADGEYEFRMAAGGGRGGRGGRGGAPAGPAAFAGGPENSSVVTLDGVKISTVGRVAVKAGPHKIVVSTPARSFIESESLLEAFVPGSAGPGYGGAGGRGGAPAAGVSVNGPFNATGTPLNSPSRQRIFVCHPPATSDAASEEIACASRIFANIERRAFRRPVTDRDVAAPLAFFKEARTAGDFDKGIEGGLVAILASPKFLYRAEIPPQNVAPGAMYRISDLELASRLSFFLWSSIPDNELLTLAEQGKLKDPAVLEKQVKRMLASPRANSLVTNFAFEWLKLRDMASFDPDPIVYPEFDASLRRAFQKEMELFIGSVFHEDRSALDLLNGNYTYVNERLALHYGIPNVRGDQFRSVTLTDPNRWGLLGKGALLMVTSYPNRTAPVLRGAFILESIAGTPPSPPPPNIPAFKENKDGEAAKTVRQIMEEHRANPSCNACHGVMDPLGFAFENYDSIGAWRSKDKFARTVIDSAGKLVDGTSVNGPADVRQALMKHPDQFVQTMAEKLLTYALGRHLEYYDMPGVRKIVKDAARDNYRFSSIVMGIVKSPQFEMRMKARDVAAKNTQTASNQKVGKN
jgi:mono/diheme cytochrome c family protein